MRAMTNAQMRWLFTRGQAWFGTGADGEVRDEWTHPIWTRDGAWYWDSSEQRYELAD